MVLIFENFQKNIFKGMMASIVDLPLNVISAFSDVVSYLRLFAVGYAGTVMAESFNNMALANGCGTFLSGLSAAMILFLGHTLNIVMSLMA
ncbi:V-type ATP synthase subunit I, partial [Candidatus Omnitrophus magneticus]